MKILYDHQIFSSQQYGGISRYFYELIKAFDCAESIQTKTSLLVSNNHYIANQRYINYRNFLPNRYFIGKSRLFNLFNQFNSILALKKHYFDLFHPTYYDPYFLKHLGHKPFVLTVYDMIHEKFRGTFSKRDKTTNHKKLLVEKASKIITISKSTKRDLIDILGTDESKIEVIYLGNSMQFDEAMELDVELPMKYILFVGSRGGYKNFDLFFEAVSKLLQKDRTLSLVCAGGGQFTATQLALFKALGINNQLFQYNLSDNRLAFFYKNAQLFVFPSLYEGFGIPILEAFACGCPLACSHTSSLPEIAGEGANYFDPYSVASMRETIHQLLGNQPLRTQLINNGTARLKAFSWGKTALETQKVYEKVLS